MCRKKYVRDNSGRVNTIEFISIIEDGKTDYLLNNNIVENRKVYYRPERTWDDHFGNTPCGYYVIVKLPTKERKRVYIF